MINKIKDYIKSLKKSIEKNKMKIAIVAIVLVLMTIIWFLGGKDYWQEIINSKAGSAAVDKPQVDKDGKPLESAPRDISKMKESDVCREYLPWGTHEYQDKAVKDRSLWMCKKTFTMQYDPVVKYPLWLSEIITKKNLVKFNIPESLQLKDDETIPLNMQHKLETFKKLPEGYKIGLLAPILNRYLNMDSLKLDKLNEINYKSLKEAFSLTNAYPVANDAKVVIDKIDQKIRDFAEEKYEVYVVSGLVYLNGSSLSSVQDGDDKILTPTHIYKIVTYPNTYASIAYIIPNTNNLPCGKNCSPDNFTVTMQEVERVTGIEFYTKLAPYYAVQVKKDLNQMFKNVVKEK